MLSLTWPQINAWRLSQHHLHERAARPHLLDVVRDIGGLHAQLMSAAELSLWARVQDLSPADVQDALWRDRTLVKTWAMRGTLHLLTAREFPSYVAALSTLRHFRRGSWLKYHGVTLAELDALMEGVRATLTDSGIPREQLANAIADKMQTPKLRDLLLSGWGALLKPVAFRGDLCFGPNQGQNITFVRPDKWLGEWPPVAPEDALKDIARRYLTAYGPATMDEFARWLGLEPGDARKIYRSLGDEIVEVQVESLKGWALTSTVSHIQSLGAPDAVRLLPHFDLYTVALARQSQFLLPEAYKARVYRQQGWISPVILVDGRMEGVWEQDKQRSQIVVKVELFNPPTARIRQGIEAEAQRLGDFLESKVEVTYSQS